MRTESAAALLGVAGLSCGGPAGPCPDGFEPDEIGNCLEIPAAAGDDDATPGPCNPAPDELADRPVVQAPHPGDAWLATQAEVDSFCETWDGVSGNLSLGAQESAGGPPPGPSDITDTTALGCLRWIGGYVHASHNDNLTVLERSSLWGTLGSTSVVLNGTMGGIRLPELQWVGGDFSVQENLGMAFLEAPKLAHIGQNLFVHGNSSLPAAQAEVLADRLCDGEIGGSVDIFDNGD